jgi:uncharacterized protein YdhG (YjbR/CyaY superfamily)
MSVVDDYLATVPEPQKSELERVRKIIRQTAPEAQEVMTYGMPGFTYKGKYLISFAAFKDHMSVFPGAEPIVLLKNQLKDYKISKGTVQFTLEHPLSESLIRHMVLSAIDRISGANKQ